MTHNEAHTIFKRFVHIKMLYLFYLGLIIIEIIDHCALFFLRYVCLKTLRKVTIVYKNSVSELVIDFTPVINQCD